MVSASIRKALKIDLYLALIALIFFAVKQFLAQVTFTNDEAEFTAAAGLMLLGVFFPVKQRKHGCRL